MIDFFHSELRPLGWKVTFVPMGWDELMKGYDEKSLQGFLVSMNMDYPETEFLIRNFESNNPDNFSGLNNAQIDLMIQKARLVTDKIQRTKFYQEVLSKIEEQAVTINLFHPRSHFWVHTCVTGFLPNILSDYYIDFRKVGLDANCLQAANP
jgi:ABC-type transport system substrate-binding protein